MASVAISLAITAGTTALEYFLTPKPKKPAPIDRGKLDDARFSIPALGAAIPKGWGTFRCAPIWIDHVPTIHTVEVTEGQSGGKGGGGTPPTADERKHIYTKSIIGVFHNGLIHKGVSKMWFGERLVYNSNLATNEADTSALRGEAEHGVLGGGASVVNQAECSGGKKVTGLGNGGHVTITIDAPTTGDYEIAAFYTSTSDLTFKVQINGGSLNDLFCPASGGAGEVTSEVIKLGLTAGANTIKFQNSGAACPDLDRIDVVPALVFTGGGEDPRGFTGITRPGRFGPDNADYAWPVANEQPQFSEPEGGVTNGGFNQAVLSEWGNPTIRFYNGSELQDADPITIALRGVDLSPGYRGLGIIAIDNIQLQNGQMPNVTLEVQQGMREVPAIVADIYNEVNVPPSWLDLSALNGKLLGDESGFDPGTYGAITWTGLNNATQTGGGAITKTSGTDNNWDSYANSGDSVSVGTNASIRFTAGSAATYMIGFAYTTTPSGALPHPYDQVPFAVLLNKNSNPSQEAKNAIQLSIGGNANTFDVGVWSPGDQFQVEYRNGRFMAYQNGLALTGFTPPVPSTFPLRPVFVGYAIGGGPSTALFATGANIGTEPIVANGGGLFMESPGPAADMIAALMLRFQFTLPEVDGVVKAVLNNATSDLTIGYQELRAHRGDSRPAEDMVITRVDPLTLAKRTTVTYSDPAYSYHTRTQSEPRLFGPQQGVTDIVLPMIETAQNMKNLAITVSNREEIEGQGYKFALGPKYMHIHQGTVLTVNARSGTSHKVRVKELGLELPAGIVDVEGVRQDAAVFSPNGTPSDIGIEAPVITGLSNTKGLLLDGVLLRAEDAGDGSQMVIYVPMCGRGSGTWPGGFLYKEVPYGSGIYRFVCSSDKPSGIGVTDGILPSVSDPAAWDRDSTLTVNFYSTVNLGSVLESELLTDQQLNLAAVRNPSDGEIEYVQFADVTPLTAAAPYRSKYELSTFLRGRILTEHNVDNHTTADDFVIMDATVIPLQFNVAEIDRPSNFKFVTAGQGLDIVPALAVELRGISLRPASIVNPRGTRDSGNDLLIEFEGRTRIGGGLRSNQAGALNEEEEIYKIQILNSGSTTLPNGLERILTVVPGMQQAAVLTSSAGFTNISHNNITAQTTAYSVQQIHGPSNFAEATLRAKTSSFFMSFIAIVKAGTALEYLDAGNEFPLPDKLSASMSALPYMVGLETFTLGQQRLRVWEYGTKIFSASDDSGESDYDPDFGWHSLGDGSTMFRVRFNFVGSSVRIQKANAANVPLTTIVTGSRQAEFPVFLYGSAGSANYQVQNVILTTYPFPKTIYSAAQQSEDGFTPGSAIQMDIWQFSKLTGDGVKTRVTL